jgi:hypothetical protein
MNSSATTTATQQADSGDQKEARLSAVASLLSYAILAGGLATIMVAVYVVILGHSKLPYWDGWTQIDFAANEGPGHTLDWLWRQFNQHRVVIPKLFLLADLRWFHATQTFLLVSNLVIQLMHLLLLAWSMRVLGGWRGRLWRTAVGLVAFCLFCPSQWPNMVLGFTGLCCYLPPFLATVSAVGLLLHWRSSREGSHRARWMYLLLSVAAGLCATYSLSNGNLIWPLLLIVAILLRVRAAAIVTIVAVAAAGIFAFFYNYTVYLTPEAVSSSGQLVGLVRYIAVYFGSSWVTSNVRTAELLGVAGFLILAFVLWRLPGYFRAAPAMAVQFSFLLLFALGTGVITAPGRLVFGLDQAFSGRYQSFALLFWGCMGLLLLGMASLRPREDLFLFSQFALVAIMFFAASKTQTLLLKVRWHGFNVNLAAVALETGIPDTAQLAWADSHADYARGFIPFMRDQHLSVFTEAEPYSLGRELNSEFTVEDRGNCTGKIELVTPIAGGGSRSLRISGWAWDVRENRAPSKVVVATDGIITGLGLGGDLRPKQEVGAQTTGQFAGFVAYVPKVSRSSKLDIYAVSDENSKSACYIASVGGE